MIATIVSEILPAPRWRKRALIAAFAWFLVCLLYGAPAALFATLLQKAAPPLQLQNVSGSFWNGAAAQAFWRQGDRVFALGSFEWHLQPWSLLWLHPSARVAANYGEQFFDARISVSPLGTLTLTNTSAALPATLLANFAPLPARGQFALKFDRAEISARSNAPVRALQGTVYWQQAQWQWNSHWYALGDYRCTLQTPAPQQLRCDLQGQGALGIEGNADMNTGEHSWALQVQVKVAPTLPDEFRQGIQLMLAAQPDAQGKLQVKRSGRW